MSITRHLLLRLVIVTIPLLVLYFFSELAFKVNRQKVHPTDVGLGIALLLAFVLIILFIGFIADLIIRLRKKQYPIAIMNIPFLLAFSAPILNIVCLMTSRGCFCSWIITTVGLFG